MLKRIALVGALILLLGSGLLAWNTVRLAPTQFADQATPANPADVALSAEDAQRLASSLSQAVQFKTISSDLPNPATSAQFEALQTWLQQRYPRVHASMKRERVGEHSLLYQWPGTDGSRPPILLMAHQDVVPVAPGTESTWQQAPFSGAMVDGFVWGRGAWDDKGNLIAQMEAAENLLAHGFKPKRTIYFAFGGDEETSGKDGNARMAALLRQRGVHFEFALDEGLLITQGVFPGLNKPLALIGVAEKGYLSVRIRTLGSAGHSSMPPPAGTGAVGQLARALAALETEQLPANIHTGVASDMFRTVAPSLGGINRVALSNLWLFGPLLERQLAQAPSTNAMLRTTTALTMLNAGNKDNVLPGVAEAVVNFRLLPGDTRAAVEAHVRQVLDRTLGASAYQLEALEGSSEPSPISAHDAGAYRQIAQAVASQFPDAVIAPGLMIGATDSRYYADLCDNVYKFSPVFALPDDLARFHGSNERISIKNLTQIVQFYQRLLALAA